MRLTVAFISILFCQAFSSCTDYYISSPQPIDSKNIYTLPKKYTGTWRLNELKGGGPFVFDSLIIRKDYYKRISRTEMIVPTNEIEMDSNIYFLNGKVYSSESGSLEGGYNYITINDSVVIDVLDIKLIEFGLGVQLITLALLSFLKR
jgi:hypothetical protein